MKQKIPPRETPNRDDFYMGLAFWMASKSKDPSTQVGAVIVDSENHALGWGYNGPPRLIRDGDIDWDRPQKYPFIKHAEANAIKHSLGDIRGATIYVTGRPCDKCMLDIVDAEISRVVYYMMKNGSGSSMLHNEEIWKTAQEIARLGYVRLNEYEGNLNWMRDRMKWMEENNLF